MLPGIYMDVRAGLAAAAVPAVLSWVFGTISLLLSLGTVKVASITSCITLWLGTRYIIILIVPAAIIYA